MRLALCYQATSSIKNERINGDRTCLFTGVGFYKHHVCSLILSVTYIYWGHKVQNTGIRLDPNLDVLLHLIVDDWLVNTLFIIKPIYIARLTIQLCSNESKQL